MNSKWSNLSSPPVIMAIFQIKYQSEEILLSDFLKHDNTIRHEFPNRNDNYHANIDMPRTFAPGISTVTGKADTKINSYIYFSKDQKRKLILEVGSITYTDENKYNGWDDFKKQGIKSIDYFKDILEKSNIKRISIRFINKLSFDTFNDPLEYFTTTISTADPDGLPFPLAKYAFKLNVIVPNSNINSIINQTLEPISKNQTDYIFDIDVLDTTNLIFDISLIEDKLEQLRDVKNTIFFKNITQKTIDLCN